MAYSKLTLNRETQVYEGTETEWSHKNPGTKETRPIYVRDLWGNPGYWKLAIARTPGTSYWQNSWGNCSLGASNRIYARFENDGQELYTQLRQAYDAICDEKAIQARATRAKNAAKPKVAPQPVVVRQPKAKKPEKVAVSFEVSHKQAAMQEKYPSQTYVVMDRDEARDAYEKWYDANHTERLGMAWFDLRASKKEA